MKINDILAIQERIQGDTYVMSFYSDTEILPPFRVATDTGETVYIQDEYTIPVSKFIDLATGQTTVIYQKPTETQIELWQLQERQAADAEYISMLEDFSAKEIGGAGNE